MSRSENGTIRLSFSGRSRPAQRIKVTGSRWRVWPVYPTKSSIEPRKSLLTWRRQNLMLKANRGWPRSRFSGTAQSERKKQSRSSVCLITSQKLIAKLDEEVFDVDCNFDARPRGV